MVIEQEGSETDPPDAVNGMFDVLDEQYSFAFGFVFDFLLLLPLSFTFSDYILFGIDEFTFSSQGNHQPENFYLIRVRVVLSYQNVVLILNTLVSFFI